MQKIKGKKPFACKRLSLGSSTPTDIKITKKKEEQNWNKLFDVHVIANIFTK